MAIEKGKEKEDKSKGEEAPVSHRLAIARVPVELWVKLGRYARKHAFGSRSAAALFILNRFFLKETSNKNSSEGDM